MIAFPGLHTNHDRGIMQFCYSLFLFFVLFGGWGQVEWVRGEGGGYYLSVYFSC